MDDQCQTWALQAVYTVLDTQLNCDMRFAPTWTTSSLSILPVLLTLTVTLMTSQAATVGVVTRRPL